MLILPQFDNLPVSPIIVLNAVPVPYKGLNFSEFDVLKAGTAGVAPGVVPESPQNYAAYGLFGELAGPSVIGTTGTKTNYFNLNYFYYGCLVGDGVEQAQVASPCSFNVTPKYVGGTKGSPVTLSFTPTSKLNANMTKATFGSAFRLLTEIDIAFLQTGVTSVDNVLLVDNVTYTTFP